MAIRFRHLTPRHCAWVMIFTLLAPLLPAQKNSLPSRESGAGFRAFCINLNGYVEGLFYDYQNTQVALSANNAGLSSLYPVPPGGLITLYREFPPTPPETQPRRENVAQARFGPGGPWILLISATRNPAAPDQPAIRLSAIDSSFETHPIGKLRVFNFAPKPIAVQLGQDMFELAPGQDRVSAAPYSERAEIRVKMATHEGGEWQLRINRPQRIPPREMQVRLAWAVIEIPANDEHPEPRYLMRNFVDSTPAIYTP